MPSYHVPVLTQEVLKYLNPPDEGWVVDGTLGGGGHSELILKHTGPRLRILGIDQDPSALAAAKQRLKRFGDRVTFVHGNFGEIKNILKKAHIMEIGGFLLDLGVSSAQLERPERGFSFMRNGPLDMRMDPGTQTTAADLLKTLSDSELEKIIKDYGEERHYKRVVRAIRKAQATKPITTTLELSQILSRALSSPRPQKIHPSTRTFQALRIAVNRELKNLTTALGDSIGVLSASARILVISFHSLEDRIAKNFFRDQEKGCICPPEIPVCVCGRKTTLKVLTRRPVVPSPEEVARNPRASSAKLRVAERVYG